MIAKPDKLFKTTIVVWTDYDPKAMEFDTLAEEAMRGDAFCSSQTTVVVEDAGEFPNTDFFGVDQDDDTPSVHYENEHLVPGSPINGGESEAGDE